MKKISVFMLICTIAVMLCACVTTTNPPTPNPPTPNEVKFMVGEEVYYETTAETGRTVTLPGNPEVDNYTFDGWYLDDGVWSKPFTADTVITANTTVYAKLTRNIYTVTFKVNGEDYKTATTDNNGKITMPGNPTVDNYTFGGWYLDDGAWTQPFTAETPVNANITVYAKLTRNIYTVTFKVNGEDYKTATTDSNGKITMPSNPTVDNYTFEGWYLDDNVWSKPFTAETAITANTTVYAKLTRNIYTVTFKVNGEDYKTATTDNNGKIVMPSNPTVDNYTFGGWYLDDGVWTQPFTADTVITANTTVYAKLTRNIYTVTFKVNGADYKTETTDNSGKIVMPSTPEVDNYTFGGWYLDDGAWTQPFTADTPINASISVYAKFTRNAYTVTFKVNGADYKTETTDNSGKIVMPGNPTVANYTFGGWYLDDSVWSKPFTADTVITANTIVYAKLTRNIYTVTFKVNGAEYKTATTDNNGKITMPSNPTVDNYTFGGWYLDDGAWTQPFTADTVITANTTVYAKFTRNIYTVTFKVNGADYKTATTDNNGKIVMPSNPEVDNYTFGGWYLDDGAWTQPFMADTPINASISVYAKFTRNAYTVTFKVNGADYKTATTDNSGKIVMPGNPTVDNYTFEGWYLDDSVWSKPFTADTTITANTTVYAKLTRNIYTVTFKVNGTDYKTATTDSNGKIVMPSNPTVDNYTFEGWYLDDSVWSKPFTANTPINASISVYAKFTRIAYTVTFKVNGEDYKTATTDNSGKITLPANPDLTEDYEFNGWFYDDGEWKKPFSAETEITQNVEVFAKITKVKFSVTFNFDGEEYKVVKTDNSGKITMPDEPNYGVGYTFEGWYLDDGKWTQSFDGSNVTEDVTVYAKLTKQVLNPTNGGTIGTLNIGSKVWSTNEYKFTSLPKALQGKPYILWTINGPNKATAIKSGWVYAITGEALDFGTAQSQMEKLDGYNFTLLDTAFWNLWDAALKNNFIYEKYVEAGEQFELGRWSVVIMSDEKLDIHAGEPIETDDKLAVLKPTGTDVVGNMELNAKVFTDRTYTFYDMPYWLAGKNYLQVGYGPSSHSATVTKSGIVYMFTSKAGNISITNALVSAGWQNVTDTIPADLNLFGDTSQNGAFLNSTYQGFAMLKKSVNKGDTITWGKWGFPVFSGEFVLDGAAKLVSAAATTVAAKTENEMRLFSDRTYYAMNGIPLGLENTTYFMDGITTGATVRAETAGTAYIMLPSGTNAYKALESEVVAAGWTKVAHRPVRLAVGLLFANRMYSKTVTAGEQIHFGKYNIIFGAAMDANDYYVMPSLTTAAEVRVNPVGDLYNTDLQKWLGCPTVEKTAGGRLWAGWFTGGERELGTGNYAIIKTSDDGNTWKNAVAIVHPDTAVQVTKPELWTAPNGDLWLIWIQHTGTGNFDGKMGTWASVCKNPDAAEPTWSAPKRLTDGYMRSKPIIVDVNGVKTWLYAAFDWMEPHYTRVYASVDNGENWTLRGKSECLDYSSGKNNLDDPVLVQKPDGRLWLLTRPSTGTSVYESFSSDGGFTWTHAKPSHIVGPQSRFTVDLLSDGRMLMVFHDATSRSRLTAYLSEDGGETFPYKLLLDERSGVSYPDTIISADGEVYVIYDRNRTTDREVWMTRFTLDDVKAGEYKSTFSKQKILVDKTDPA